MKNLYYLAHPVGPNADHTYAENIAAGVRHWVALLRAGVRVCAPWVGLCHALDDTVPSDRLLGMSIDLDVMRRCDGIIACGDRMSLGMKTEWDEMSSLGKIRVDLIGEEISPAGLLSIYSLGSLGLDRPDDE